MASNSSPSSQEDTNSHSERKLPRRQILSCLHCRQRKVKCDRTLPCSACCARGRPKECRFIVSEGNDFEPIQQSYEIRQLRSENQALREKLRDLYSKATEEASGDDTQNETVERRHTISKQVRLARRKTRGNMFRSKTRTLIEVLSLPSSVPRHHNGLRQPWDEQLVQQVGYPFQMVTTGDNTTAALTRLLPTKDEVLAGVDIFQSLCRSFPVPQPPDKMRREEIDVFFANLEVNATRSPDILALLFAAMAVVSQATIRSENMPGWVDPRTSHARSQCYVAASMQALRDASFMLEPTLAGVKTLLVIGFHLSQAGRIQEAWVLFGMTTRLAYSLDLHRDPASLDQPPSPRDCAVRRGIWWFMLYTDLYLSLMLAKPLCISVMGNSPPPAPWSNDAMEARLCGLMVDFVLAARQILGSDATASEEKLIRKGLKELMDLWDTTPEVLKFDSSWTHLDQVHPQWPLDIIAANLCADIHYCIVALSYQLTLLSHTEAASDRVEAFENIHDQFDGLSTASSTRRPSTISINQDIDDEHQLMMDASFQILRAFLYLWKRKPTTIIYCTSIQQTANTAMLLTTKLWERGDRSLVSLIEQVQLAFVELLKKGTHQAFEPVVRSIAEELASIER